MLNIGVLGTGYVGLVTGACLASCKDSIVTCFDIDKSKIDMLRDGVMPIYEKDLEALVEQNVNEYRLFFEHDMGPCLDSNKVIFIAVGTPSRPDGSVDLSYVQSACEMIEESCVGPKIVVMKSTVPVGTHRKMNKWLKGKHVIVSNPEFLREGTAVYDFFRGDRIVIGRSEHNPMWPIEEVDRIMRGVYSDWQNKIVWTDNASAEIIKYASNCLLASKLALWNEIAYLCSQTGANIHEVRRGVGSDSRIGPRFLLAGPGYGGSCFPKDTRGLYHMFRDNIKEPVYGDLIKAIIESNDHHKGLPYKLFWDATLADERDGMKIAILGLAFKGGTDDTRESPTHTLLKQLDDDECDYEIVVADPIATELPDIDREVTLTTDYVKALQDADVVIVMTEWQQYKNIDPDYVDSLMHGNVVIDTRNMWDRKAYEDRGFIYRGIGG